MEIGTTGGVNRIALNFPSPYVRLQHQCSYLSFHRNFSNGRLTWVVKDRASKQAAIEHFYP